MLTKGQFLEYCAKYRKQQERIHAAYKLDIDLIEFCEPFWAMLNMLGNEVFKEKYELIQDYILGQWNGKIYNKSNSELMIEHIKSDSELYDYITKL